MRETCPVISSLGHAFRPMDILIDELEMPKLRDLPPEPATETLPMECQVINHCLAASRRRAR